jgi:hypothetical protein
MAGEVIAIIHSGNQKADMEGPPREVWSSSRFQLYLAHAEIFCDEVFVLSDEYGLIGPDKPVKPSDANIKYATATEALKWWGRVKQEIRNIAAMQPKIVILYIGNFERNRILREFARNGCRNVIFPFGNVGISERLELIYDMESPYNEDKLAAGEYLLPTDFGEPKKRGRKPKDRSNEASTEYTPPDEDAIQWEVPDDDDTNEAE